jgi:hypothetical protein
MFNLYNGPHPGFWSRPQSFEDVAVGFHSNADGDLSHSTFDDYNQAIHQLGADFVNAGEEDIFSAVEKWAQWSQSSPSAAASSAAAIFGVSHIASTQGGSVDGGTTAVRGAGTATAGGFFSSGTESVGGASPSAAQQAAGSNLGDGIQALTAAAPDERVAITDDYLNREQDSKTPKNDDPSKRQDSAPQRSDTPASLLGKDMPAKGGSASAPTPESPFPYEPDPRTPGQLAAQKSFGNQPTVGPDGMHPTPKGNADTASSNTGGFFDPMTTPPPAPQAPAQPAPPMPPAAPPLRQADIRPSQYTDYRPGRGGVDYSPSGPQMHSVSAGDPEGPGPGASAGGGGRGFDSAALNAFSGEVTRAPQVATGELPPQPPPGPKYIAVPFAYDAPDEASSHYFIPSAKYFRSRNMVYDAGAELWLGLGNLMGLTISELGTAVSPGFYYREIAPGDQTGADFLDIYSAQAHVTGAAQAFELGLSHLATIAESTLSPSNWTPTLTAGGVPWVVHRTWLLDEGELVEASEGQSVLNNLEQYLPSQQADAQPTATSAKDLEQYIGPQPAEPRPAASPQRDPAKVLTGLVEEWTERLTKDPKEAMRFLSREEQLAPRFLGPANFGKALERAVGEQVDLYHSDILKYVGGPNQPDFKGLGAFQGRTFDITTYRGQQSHYARPYGSKLELILYDSLTKAWP